MYGILVIPTGVGIPTYKGNNLKYLISFTDNPFPVSEMGPFCLQGTLGSRKAHLSIYVDMKPALFTWGSSKFQGAPGPLSILVRGPLGHSPPSSSKSCIGHSLSAHLYVCWGDCRPCLFLRKSQGFGIRMTTFLEYLPKNKGRIVRNENENCKSAGNY